MEFVEWGFYDSRFHTSSIFPVSSTEIKKNLSCFSSRSIKTLIYPYFNNISLFSNTQYNINAYFPLFFPFLFLLLLPLLPPALTTNSAARTSSPTLP